MKTMKLKLFSPAIALLAALLIANTGRAQSNLPPVITNPPQSVLTTNGYAAWKYVSSGMFKVTATGTAPLSYQWQFNGTNLPNGGNFSGSTSASLTVVQVTNADAGPYDVVITNTWGSVTSSVATLTIATPPSITNQPASQWASNLATVTFSVGAAGTGPFAYQWQLNGTNLPNNIITTVAGNGTNGYSGDGGAGGNASLFWPSGVALDAAGNLFIADADNQRIREVNANGIISTVAGDGSFGYTGEGQRATNSALSTPRGVAVDANDNLFIVDSGDERVREETNGILNTVAGNGVFGYSGDGGAATNAELYTPFGVAVDAQGNVYIADMLNSRIRRVDVNGVITTVAGNGANGDSGDGGAATNASLNSPEGVTVDANGNLFIADTGNDRIRRVDTNGMITTVATAADPTGVALDADGDVYISETQQNYILKADTAGNSAIVAGNGNYAYTGDGGAATNASLWNPAGVAVDAAGNLYIADTENNRIRKVTTQGPALTLTNVNSAGAGNYQVIVSSPWGSVTSSVVTLTLDYPPAISTQPTNQYVVLGGNATLSVAATGTAPLSYQWQFMGANLTDGGQVAGSATASLALNTVTAGNAGNYDVVISNAWGSVTSSTAILYIGTPPVITNQPVSQVIGSGSNASFSVTAYGTSQTGSLSYHWQLNGTNLAASQSVIDPNASTMTLERVTNSAYAGSYDVVVSNSWGSVTSRVVTLTIAYPPTITNQPAGQLVTTVTNATFSVGAAGTGPFSYQWLLNGKFITNNIITTVAGNGAGAYAGDGGPATNASLWYPAGVAVDAAGNLFIADTDNNRIRKVNENGIITTVAGDSGAGYGGNGGVATNTSLYYPSGVAVDENDNLFIADTYNNRIRVETYDLLITVAGNGSSIYSGDGGDAFNAGLDWPAAVVVDANGNVYIADTEHSRIRRVDINDVITTVAGKGTFGYSGDGGAATNAALNTPFGLAVDAAGNLFIADSYNNRIRRVDTNGVITTVAGNGEGGYFGDGGAATNAWLNHPAGVTVDADGNLLIADTYNQRVRKVNPAGIITTVAGRGVFGYAGDGGAATNADLNYPCGVAVDASGDLFIVDAQNGRIRKVTPQGPALTLANVNGVNVTNGGNYQVIVSSTWGSVTSSVARLTVELPPALTLQPTNQIVVNGSRATLSVAATGTTPLSYQWQFNGTNLPTANFSSSTNATLTLSQVSAVLAGPYEVIITNAWGSVTSRVAVLSLVYPPAITNQPMSQNIINGSNAVFSVAATGTAPLAYQWQFNGINLTDGGNLSGSATASLTLTGAGTNNAGDYDVIITNAWGGVTSSLAALNIVYPPAISNQPSNQISLSGGSVAFSIGVTGTGPFTYQWLLNGTNLPDGIISTVAGDGTEGYTGDGGAATNASLSIPSAVAVDAAGNLFIADSVNQCVRRVDANGVITTVAGNGSGGYSGDGGAATNASLYFPTGVAVDAGGDLYIADTDNSRIRKVTPDGLIATVAGNGNGGYSGDGGAATNASLRYPAGVAVDADGDLFIADTENQLIRKVDANGIITTVAGDLIYGFSGDDGAATNASLNYPAGVTVDAAGDLFIADTENDCIREVDTNGLITTVAGIGSAGYSGDGGVATNASLSQPYGVAVDADGDLFIADTDNQRIREVDGGGYITTVAGDGNPGYAGDGGAATLASLYDPAGVAVDAFGDLFIADSDNDRIRKAIVEGPALTLDGVTTNLAGNYQVVVTSPWGSVTSSVVALTIAYPPAITRQPANQNVVLGNAAVFSVTPAGTEPLGYVWQFNGTDTTNSGNFFSTTGLNLTLTLNSVTTGNAGVYDVILTNAWGSVTSSVASLTINYPPAITNSPASQSILLGGNGAFSVGATGTGPLGYQWLLDGTNLPNGIIFTLAGNGNPTYSGDGGLATNASLSFPSGVAVDAAGNLYIADTDNQRIRKINPNGLIATVAGTNSYGYSGDGGAAAAARLNYPAGVAVDGQGNLYIADTGNQRVRIVNTNGIITTVAGNGSGVYFGDGGAATNASLYDPAGVAVDAAGNLFIADMENQRIRKVNANGLITTVAGRGISGYSGDGGAATNAELAFPSGVAVDAYGNLFIADKENQRLRMVNSNGIISTVAGTGTEGYSGNGGAATSATLNLPSGVAVDAAGNLFIADSGNQRIRKVAVNGLLTTVAGNGDTGFADDGGPAVNAWLNDPAGVAVDAYGNLFIADEHNDRVRKVIEQGSVLPLTGVTAANAGNYQVVITNAYGSVTSSVVVLTLLYPPTLSQQPVSLSIINDSNATFGAVAAGTAPLAYQWQFEGVNLKDGGGLSGSATASLRLTQATAANAGGYDLVVTNPWGSITSSVVTLAVTYPPTLLTQPVSQALKNGTPAAFSVGVIGTGPFTYQWLYDGKALPGNHITTVAGNGTNGYSGDGGAATNAELNTPSGVAVDADGNLFIADAGNRVIRMVSSNGLITTVVGGGLEQDYPGGGLPPTDYYLSLSDSYSAYSGVAVDADDNLFIADTEYQRVLLVTYDVLLTLAGGGSAYPGNGTNATLAMLEYPSGVAVDADGNLFFSDTDHQRVCRVNSEGILTTVAGTNYGGFAGDGGAATNAELSYPAGVAVDASGNLFIADYENNRIRKVNAGGIITTVAGKSGGGYSGDGGAATNTTLDAPVGVAVDASGNLFIADTFNRRIRQVTPAGIITTVVGNGTEVFPLTAVGDGGAGTNASLTTPVGVAVDAAGNLFIVDAGNNRIRRLTPQGPVLSLGNANATNAGNYQVIVSSPSGSVTSSVVTLTVLLPPSITRQPVNQSIAAGGSGTFSVTVAGTGLLAYQWQFNGTNLPVAGLLSQGSTISLALSKATAANAGLYDVVITNAYGSVTSSVVSLTITYPPVILAQPQSMTVSAGQTVAWSVAVSGGTPLVCQWYFDGTPLTGQTGTNLQLAGVTPAAAGDYYLIVSNQYGSLISSLAALTVLGPPVITSQPAGAALIAGGSATLNAGTAGAGPLHYQWQLNGANLPGVPNLILTVAGSGAWGYFGDGGAAIYAGLESPAGLAVDAQGDLFIADTYNGRIRKVDTNGIITTVAGNGSAGYSGDGGAATNASLYFPLGVAVDAPGNLFIADYDNSCIRRVDANGVITTVAGNGYAGYSGDGGAATNANLYYPAGVAVDAGGNLFIADTFNERIRKVDTNGLITTVAGTGLGFYSGDGGAATNAALDGPSGLTLDAQGDLVIVDTGNERIRDVTANGLITTVAGNGLAGYSGDGGPATNASLNSPRGVAADAAGNLFISDMGNQRIREVGTNGVITTLAGNGSEGYSGDGGMATNASLNYPFGLAVDAADDLFIADEDNNVIREIIPSGNSPILALNSLTANNAGNYQLIIANGFGSVTSSIVTLTVSLPQISAAPNTNGTVTLNLLTAPNTSSEVLAATNLTPPVVWQSLGSYIPGTNGLWQFIDTNASQSPVRFYRSSTP